MFQSGFDRLRRGFTFLILIIIVLNKCLIPNSIYPIEFLLNKTNSFYSGAPFEFEFTDMFVLEAIRKRGLLLNDFFLLE